MRVALGSFAVLLAACPSDPGPSSAGADTMTVDFSTTDGTATTSSPSTTQGATVGESADTSGGSPTTAAPDTSGGDDPAGCSFVDLCDEGSFCVAPYADNDRGAFVCVDACVGPGDEDSWCFDATACCDPTATCTERGYCVGAGDTDGSSGSDGGSGTTGGG